MHRAGPPENLIAHTGVDAEPHPHLTRALTSRTTVSLPSRGPILCLVTDRRRLAGRVDEELAVERVVQQVERAGRAGIHLVQVRERDLSGRALAALVARCVHVVRGTAARIVVNDRVDVALAAGAAGVHLRADSVDATRVRTVVPRGFLIGRSVHSAEEAEKAAFGGGLDYLILGAVFATATKPRGRAPLGVDEVARTARLVDLPVLAIGGVTVERASALGRAGAAGLAAIGLFADSVEDRGHGGLASVVGALRRAFDTS